MAEAVGVRLLLPAVLWLGLAPRLWLALGVPVGVGVGVGEGVRGALPVMDGVAPTERLAVGEALAVLLPLPVPVLDGVGVGVGVGVGSGVALAE